MCILCGMSAPALAQTRRPMTAEDLFRIAGILWIVILCVCAGRIIARPTRGSVYATVFSVTGQRWLAGQVIYYKGEYRYSPLVAAMLAPLGALPLRVGSLIWLAINAVLFFWGFLYWARVALPGERPRWMAPAILLLATPILVGNFANLQSNAMVLGLMLGSIAATHEKRWNLVALCIVAATLLKIYPLALGLVLLVQYPKHLSWRLLVGLIVSALLPFVLQRPEYVADCYRKWLWVLQNDDRSKWGPYLSYKDAAMLFRAWKHPINPLVYKCIQAAGAGLVGLLALLLRKYPQPQRLMVLLGSVLLWILILGPSTESATHMLVAPMLAWMLVESLVAPWPKPMTFLAFAAYALLVLTDGALTMPWGRKLVALGTQPLAELLVAACFVAWAIRSGAQLASDEPRP